MEGVFNKVNTIDMLEKRISFESDGALYSELQKNSDGLLPNKSRQN